MQLLSFALSILSEEPHTALNVLSGEFECHPALCRTGVRTRVQWIREIMADAALDAAFYGV